MTYSVYYAELGIELNLSEPDLGHPELPSLWEMLRSDKRPVPQRQLQCMECRASRPHCPEWMFLTERDGRRFASHYSRNIADHASSNESDQHKAFKERIANAAELGGHLVEVEDRADDGKRRTDVLVKGDGDLAIGWEVQLSYAGVESVRRRTQIARTAGITPSWMVVDATREFINKVPWTLTPDMPWRQIRDGQALPIRGGVRKLQLHDCDWNNPLPCPVKGGGRCGQRHPAWESIGGYRLDDLVRESAAGEFVQIIVPGQRVTNRWWVRRTDRDLFAESAGGLLTEGDVKQRRRKEEPLALDPQPVDPECRYGQDSGYRSAPAVIQDSGATVVTAATVPVEPRRITASPPLMRIRKPGICYALANRDDPHTYCLESARLYTCGWRCERHKP
jgi:hypothetical protein